MIQTTWAKRSFLKKAAHTLSLGKKREGISTVKLNQQLTEKLVNLLKSPLT